MRKLGIRVHSVFKISDVMNILVNNQKLDQVTEKRVMAWVRDNPSNIIPNVLNEFNTDQEMNHKRLGFKTRAEQSRHPFTKKLLSLIDHKQTNLCVALDLTSAPAILELADKVGPHICVLKLHVDLIQDFSLDKFVKPLQELAQKHNFFLFEDRKYADIGNTVSLQYNAGVYQTSLWSHIVNAHIVAGPGTVEGLKKGLRDPDNRVCILVAEMSSKGNLMDKNYSQAAYVQAKEHEDFVIGFVSQNRVTCEPQFVTFTPGVQLESKGDSLGQQYTTPEEAVSRGADIVIVGRGVSGADDPQAMARLYQERSYRAYTQQSLALNGVNGHTSA
jgi:uridine monophosphate synthetase